MPTIPVSTLVRDAKAKIDTLSIAQVQSRVAAGTARLVDIRDIRELDRTGRIAGAIHAPRGMLEFWVDPASPYHKPELSGEVPLILFCAGAQRSALAAATLRDMGLTDTSEMEGGFSAWAAGEHPVERPVD